MDYDVWMPWENVGRWELSVVLFHFAEVAVGLEDGIGVFEVERQHEHSPCERVIKSADEQAPCAHAVGKILVEQKQIVAEIKVCLPGIGSGKTASAEMIYG